MELPMMTSTATYNIAAQSHCTAGLRESWSKDARRKGDGPHAGHTQFAYFISFNLHTNPY